MDDETRAKVQKSLDRIATEVDAILIELGQGEPVVDWDTLVAQTTFNTLRNVIANAFTKEEIRGHKRTSGRSRGTR